jgi:8-oxo-dGTP diphosphatase
MTRVVAAIIQDDAGNFLCAKRGHWKSSAGKWEFPGGKTEANENLEDALRREILEELGVEVNVLREFHRNNHEDIELISFVCELVSEKPIASTDHSELRWVAEKDLALLDWAEADIPIVKKITIPYC